MDEVGEIQDEAVAPQRKPRPLAVTLWLLPVAAVVVLAVQVSFLVLMLAPLFSVFAYAAWLGLTNDEMLKAFGNARVSDDTGMNPW